MSEQQQPPSDTLPEKLKWGDSLNLLSDELKSGLAQQLWAWRPEMATDQQPGPFAGEELNGLEVFWLAICAQAGADGDTSGAEETVRKATVFENETDVLYLPTLYLQGAFLMKARLEKSTLDGAQLQSSNLTDAQLQGASLIGAQLERANLDSAQLQGAFLGDAQLQNAILYKAQLQGATLDMAQLEAADLRGAQLEAADLSKATLLHADLRQASLDKRTNLDGAILKDVRLDGVIFDNTNLTAAEWSVVQQLQDERLAHQSRYPDDDWKENRRGNRKSRSDRTHEYQAAARAYRLLSVALQAKGMSEEAAGYAYRAQVMQRRAHWHSGGRSWGRWFFSGFLDLLAGYGYKPLRSLAAYLATIAGFMGLYLLNSHFATPHLSWDEALVLSVSSFHGRGFFTQNITLGDTYARLAAAEAVIGLLIEISFIATFTQRFFGSK